MDFIKKHYEKVILLGLFVIFIGLMFLVQSVISSTREVKDKDLALPARRPDYVNEDAGDKKFDTAERWEASHFDWQRKAHREKDELPVSDFVKSFSMAECPHCGSEDESGKYTMLIPVFHFNSTDKELGKCPECQNQLQPPLNIDVVDYEYKFYAADEDKRLKTAEEEKKRQETENQRQEDEKDRDDDGLPNEVEERFGMDPNDRYDVRYDIDGDGFSNIFELENKTMPNDPKDHPPMWWRLQLKDIRQIELPVKFMALNDNANQDKNTWQLQFNYPDPNPRRAGRLTSSYLRIGSTIKIEGKTYRVEDVERKIIERKRAGGNLDAKGELVEKIDESEVTLVEVAKAGVTPDKLKMVLNKTAYSSDRRPVLVDTGNIKNKREYVLKVGDTLPIGLFATEKKEGGLTAKERRREVRFYRLKSVDIANMRVEMEEIVRASDKKKNNVKEETSGKKEVVPIIITKAGMVPADKTPIKKVEKKNDVDGDEEEIVRAPGPGVK